MKILVVSDTHYRVDRLIRILREQGPFDAMIHLGDMVEDAKRVEDEMQGPVFMVRGNCDFLDKSTPDEQIIQFEHYRLLLTHGHKYQVKHSLNTLFYKGIQEECQGILFGHTHTPINQKVDDVLLFNPGSLTLPRDTEKPSYGVIEIQQEGINAMIMRWV